MLGHLHRRDDVEGFWSERRRKGSDAEKAGVLPGSELLRIGDTDIRGMGHSEVVELIVKSPRPTRVEMRRDLKDDAKPQPKAIDFSAEAAAPAVDHARAAQTLQAWARQLIADARSYSVDFFDGPMGFLYLMCFQ